MSYRVAGLWVPKKLDAGAPSCWAWSTVKTCLFPRSQMSYYVEFGQMAWKYLVGTQKLEVWARLPLRCGMINPV